MKVLNSYVKSKERYWYFIMHKLLGIFTTACFLSIFSAFGCSTCHAQESTGEISSAEALTGKTAHEITQMMGIGWNLGNTFDATGGSTAAIYSHETSWGNPQVNEALIAGVKKAGFDTIRIPITWNIHMADDGEYTLQPEFLDRIQEVVDWAYQNHLFVILNAHHEEWINSPTLVEDQEEIAYRLACLWRQVAERFADYDQHLIFEVMNEPRITGSSIEWTGNNDAYKAVNFMAQAATYAIKDNQKGYNPERCVIVPGYAASSNPSVMQSISLPTYDGELIKNLIVSIHSYAPYDFCLSDKMMEFDPESTACTAPIDANYEDACENFLKLGIPVIFGETSATNKDNLESREKWARYVGEISAGYGIPIVLWDNGVNGNSGGECHRYLDRITGEQTTPTFITALLEGRNSVEFGSLVPEPDAPGKGGFITYYVDGQIYGSGRSDVAKEDPVLENRSFLGWYTTKDYKPGTEYTSGEATEGVSVVYGKFGLNWSKGSFTAVTEPIVFVAPKPEEELTEEAAPSISEDSESTSEEASVSEEKENEATETAISEDNSSISDEKQTKNGGIKWLIGIGALIGAGLVYRAFKKKR